ncbi:hypothetical protein HanPSC8_Chr06g0236021 [Helianthus annuus]|nr:hypothetical protein HanPSC8_Chr06g0236021 [Helianthus annuus]
MSNLRKFFIYYFQNLEMLYFDIMLYFCIYHLGLVLIVELILSRVLECLQRLLCMVRGSDYLIFIKKKN